MATLLYRLGRFAARRAWLVIVSWVVLLGLAGGAFALFGGSLTSAVSIPGTATQKVADQLSGEFPAASGGSGTVVFATEDESEFTETQKSAIADVLAEVEGIDTITATTDPFVTQAELDSQRAQVSDGATQLDAAEAQLDAGQAQLDAARAPLDAAQAQLDAARAQAESAGQLAFAQAQLDAQQAQLSAGLAQIEAQQTVLDEGRATFDAQKQQLEEGADLLGLTEGLRQVSEDGTTAIATVQFDDATTAIPTETKDKVIAVFEDANIDGVEVLVSGEIQQSIPSVFGPGEAIGLIVAAIVLIVMLGTFIGAGLPLINALVGVGVGVLASLSLSGVVDMLSVSPVLGVMLGLAVGIDYSLFIINRHRNQLRQGVELHESIGLANGTSGNAVVFAGATVLIALLALNIVGIGFLGVMGTVGAICVFVAILIAITMTPALLRIAGMRLLPKKVRNGTAKAKTVKVATKPMNTGRAVITVLGTVIVLLIVAIPALSMRLGLNTSTSEPEDSSAYRAYVLVNEKFGEGDNGALVVVAELDTPVADEDLISEQVRIGTLLRDQDDVVAIAPIGASEDETLLAFQVIPGGGPTDVSTEDLVRDLRDLELDGVDSFGVAGSASGNIDVSEKLAAALPIYVAVVVGLSLIILIFVFRSILVPVTATLGFVLSLFATFGGLTAIFQWGWLGEVFGVHAPGPVLSFLPVIVVGVLFGLAMDYQLFLVSGMREAYAHGSSARLAVQRGVQAGRSVVIAAALIMISVFAGFIFADSGLIKAFGFALSFGVLVDAFIVRLLLIPAVMHLLGDAAWWLPKWLDRILPDIDVEGSALERAHPVVAHDAETLQTK
jgi:RND superfamily putative drug exporter